MKPKTKGASIIGITLLSVIVGLVVLQFGQSVGVGPLSKLTVLAAGIPDSYGNRIGLVSVYQNTTGSWTIVTSVSYTAFTNGTTLSVPANQKTLVYATVWLNDTLASDVSTAITRTRVYITISGVTTSTLMTSSSGTYVAPYYILLLGYPSTIASPTSVWTPATDTTYTVTLQYQAYY